MFDKLKNLFVKSGESIEESDLIEEDYIIQTKLKKNNHFIKEINELKSVGTDLFSTIDLKAVTSISFENNLYLYNNQDHVIYKYVMSTNEFIKLDSNGKLPEGNYVLSLNSEKKKIYLLTQNANQNDVFQFDLETNTWSEVNSDNITTDIAAVENDDKTNNEKKEEKILHENSENYKKIDGPFVALGNRKNQIGGFREISDSLVFFSSGNNAKDEQLVNYNFNSKLFSSYQPFDYQQLSNRIINFSQYCSMTDELIIFSEKEVFVINFKTNAIKKIENISFPFINDNQFSSTIVDLSSTLKEFYIFFYGKDSSDKLAYYLYDCLQHKWISLGFKQLLELKNCCFGYCNESIYVIGNDGKENKLYQMNLSIASLTATSQSQTL
ncbi:hypothetical protein ABK040_004283 [Willaertia magna]